MVEPDPAFKAGDVIWLELEGTSGHEQKGRRPAVVVSDTGYNARSSLLLACLVTTNPAPWPFKINLSSEADGLKGFILVDQIRAIDPVSRRARLAGSVLPECLADVRARLAVLLDISPTP